MLNLSKIFFHPFAPKSMSLKKFKKVALDPKYQIIQILPKKDWEKNHIIGSIKFEPETFKTQYKSKLNKEKIIILYGDYHMMAQYYRMLNFDKFNVYLIR